MQKPKAVVVDSIRLPGLQTQMVDFNIEFSHVDVESYDSFEVASSGAVAAQIAAKLDADNKTYSVSLLVDDKNSNERMAPEDISLLLLESSKWLHVDYVVFESRLADYKLDLLENIQDSHRVSVKKLIERYESKSGRLACSHDIAIWHLMRLGKINADVSTVVPVSSHRGKMVKPFYSRNVISVLSNQDREPEEKAITDVLCYCVDSSIVARIKRHFI